MTKKALVIGYPAKHSLSPKLHNYWLKKYKIDGEYSFLEIAPDAFENKLKKLFLDDSIIGANITLPHKEIAVQIVDICDDEARKIGAVNTIVKNAQGKLMGSNSDIYGFIENIKTSCPDFSFVDKKVTVLGAGGAARAVIAGLLANDVQEISLTNRTLDRAISIKDLFGGKITIFGWQNRDKALKDCNLLINTTNLGMVGKEELDISLDNLPKNALVTDIVYRPLMTNLLVTAKARGNKIIDGLGMLIYQAVPGFNAWFGVRPQIDSDLRQLLLENL